MYPLQRSTHLLPDQIFLMDEDIDREFESICESAKRTFLNYGALSAKEISSLFHVDRIISIKIMDKIKAQFLAEVLK